MLVTAKKEAYKLVDANDILRLLPTFRSQKKIIVFFYLTKSKSVILSSVYERKTLKISKSGPVI